MSPDSDKPKDSVSSSVSLEELAEARARIAALETQLTNLREHPGRGWKDLFLHRALSWLSMREGLLSIRTRRRFSASAAKRAPGRDAPSLPEAGAHGASAGPHQFRATIRGAQVRDPSRPDVLVVTHDASRTGAPILALNLVQYLARDHNVTTLCLRASGELVEAFARSSVGVELTENTGRKRADLSDLVRSLNRATPFAFAIVNSIESAPVLQPLAQLSIATVSLVHEFASYTYPKSAFSDLFRWSSHVVFSTRLTLENARSHVGLPEKVPVTVLSQGRCVVPSDETSGTRETDEAQWSAVMRHADEAGHLVVLGAGSVQYRKGVDLFIEAAARVIHDHGVDNAVFMWVGEGYDPARDGRYSAYLQDQINRAGIEQQMVIVPPTVRIEEVYRRAGLLLLSSRLDPLPNVAIDAMCEGLPVICFEAASGIADFLIEHGFKEPCVAPFLDTAALAARAAVLIGSDERRRDVSGAIRASADVAFAFDAYAAKIVDFAREAAFRPTSDPV